ncbi:hypothetical protein SUGI_0187910 [Cryptomeria japonica]|nr:hypothetical protein SUGI_0187910 [Cryptomeria japonica]
MNKFSKNTVSAKSGRSSAKKVAGNVMTNARKIEKRGTPNLRQKALTESVGSNKLSEKISEEDVHVKKFDVFVEAALPEESVVTNDGGVDEDKEVIFKEIENKSNFPAPADVFFPEPLKTSIEDEYLRDEQLTAESSVIDDNILGTLQVYNFAAATDENVSVNRGNAYLETVITEIESQPRLCHTENDKSTLEKGYGMNEEKNIPSNVEIAAAIIKAVHAQSEANATPGMRDAFKQIIDAPLTMAAKDQPKFSPTVADTSKSMSRVCLSKSLAGALCAISMAAVCFALLSNPKQDEDSEILTLHTLLLWYKKHLKISTSL